MLKLIMSVVIFAAGVYTSASGNIPATLGPASLKFAFTETDGQIYSAGEGGLCTQPANLSHSPPTTSPVANGETSIFAGAGGQGASANGTAPGGGGSASGALGVKAGDGASGRVCVTILGR